MSKIDFTNYKVWCSEIHSLFSVPKGVKPTANELKKYNRLLNSSEEKSEEDLAYILKIGSKLEQIDNPPLSKTTISALIKQYGWKVYNKKIAQKGDALSFVKKGTDMEGEAVELLSGIDKKKYKLEVDKVENDYLIGRCDIICPYKVIDTKISWNVNAFLNARTSIVSKKYWYQMQGYMKLYDVPEAEVVFLLLNTPPELIEREKMKLINRFMIGEIDREKYEIDMENIESAFTYSNIPLKRRHFRYRIKREPEIFEKVYQRVEKARIWMQDFEREMKTNIISVPSEYYLKAEKNNTEPDASDADSCNEGG